MRKLRILFIGNSHTYMNDLPELVRQRAAEDSFDCEVTMLAHGGWFLDQHLKEAQTSFNLKYGHYDYVVLQEHSHPFDGERYLAAIKQLCQMSHDAGTRPVIYETWSQKSEPEFQDMMNGYHRRAAEENGALIAPVGENWWRYKESWPDTEMYMEDGGHASPEGSDFAAKYIWETIYMDIKSLGSRELTEEQVKRALDPENLSAAEKNLIDAWTEDGLSERRMAELLVYEM